MERSEITLNRKALLGAVEMALRVQGKPAKGDALPPIIRCVAIAWESEAEIERVGPTAHLSATSLSTWYSARLYPAREAVCGEGSVAINAADLREILRSSKAVELTIRSFAARQTVELEIGDATITLPAANGDDLPAAPASGLHESATLLELPMPQLRRLCAQASYPIAADAAETVAALVGVREDSIILSATDGRRLAFGKLRLWSTADRRRDVLIPAPALRLLATVKAECRASVRHVESLGAAPAITCVLIGKGEMLTFKSPALGTFPGVEDLLSRHRRAATAVVDRETLIGAVSRAAVIAMPIRLSLLPVGLEVASAAPDPCEGTVRERLLAEIHRATPDDPNVSGAVLNSDFLLETLAVVDTDRVVLTFGWMDEPVHVAPFGSGCSSEAQEHLIMPMRDDAPKATKAATAPPPAVTGEQLAEAMRESVETIPGIESATLEVPGGPKLEIIGRIPRKKK